MINNIFENGVGALNIDECRVGDEIVGGGTMPDLSYVGKEQKKLGNGHKMSFGQIENAPRIECEEHVGRFPANTILDTQDGEEWRRYFYCAKASKKDRDEGLDTFEDKVKVFNGKSNESSKEIKDVEQRFTTVGKNTHPTVKPTTLLQYLIRLVTLP